MQKLYDSKIWFYIKNKVYSFQEKSNPKVYFKSHLASYRQSTSSSQQGGFFTETTMSIDNKTPNSSGLRVKRSLLAINDKLRSIWWFFNAKWKLRNLFDHTQ